MKDFKEGIVAQCIIYLAVFAFDVSCVVHMNMLAIIGSKYMLF